jgi:phage-related protein
MQKLLQFFTTMLLFAVLSLQTTAQENLIRNGDFAGPGSEAGWVSIHEITKTTGAEFWHVQFNQSLKADQMAALAVGETYELTFSAKAEDAKKVAVFFGENGGSFKNLLGDDNVIDLTTDSQSFTFEFVAETFNAMKLGFEGGKDNTSYTIGNVSILKKGGNAGDNIIKNGNFGPANFQDSWFIWVADWEGITASALINDWFIWYADWEGITVDLTKENGWAKIHSITNTPGTQIWHVQFNQQLTASQIAAINNDKKYTLTFDAKAEDAKTIAVFFGQEGGAFKNLLSNNLIDLTAEEKSFSFDFVGEKFDVMKLGFEGGLNNIGYSISNVVIASSPTSVNYKEQSKIMVYPNPASDRITVKANEGSSIVLTNLMGSIVDSKTAAANEVAFEVGALPSGIYFVIIENKGERITKKIVVN